MRKKTCISAIIELMSDYEPRTSEQIADATGFSHGLVRTKLAKELSYEEERRKVKGGGRVVWYQLKRHELLPIRTGFEGATSGP